MGPGGGDGAEMAAETAVAMMATEAMVNFILIDW